MKQFLVISLGFLLGSVGLISAQSTTAASTQQTGRGRGGAPHAWNDKNRDGICDVTGQAVGQGRGNGAMRGGGRGRANGNGWGRGMGGGFRFQQQGASTQAPK
jgi:hypothetical protein